MSATYSSSRFATIYDSLPQDAQQTLIYKQLMPLLNKTSMPKVKKALSAAARLQKRHANIPDLDLRGKKLEINNMLKELNKDTKRSYVMDASNRVELLNEIVDSLAAWLNDIWAVAYEHNVDFTLAHNCLLFVSATLERLENIRMGCKCALNSLYILVTIRNRKGRIVKRFDINGAAHLEDATLFIWRDTFLSMLAYGSQRHKDMIPRMLGDIETTMGWKALVRLMYSKPKDAKRHVQSDHESDWEDVEGKDGDEPPDLEEQSDSEALSAYSTEDEDGEFDLEMPRLRHWSDIIFGHTHLLQRCVEDALTAVFEATPSLPLYSTLLSVAHDPRILERRLLSSLKMMATACPDTYAVALEIYSLEHKVDQVIELLDSHSHLLRPRDAASLQAATTLISHHGHGQRALQILEAELLDTLRVTRQALLQSFSQLDTPQNREEFQQITKMRNGAAGRRGRVEAWVDAVTTPGADQPNPMMFAAMFMGIGPVPGLNSDDDPYTYLDLDPHDPDLEDLRSEYRPNLKKRFESWADVGLMLKGGPPMLLTVYRKIVETLPFLRAPDVTEEMIGRLQDRPSKAFVVDGLDALLAFVKVQRRKWKTMITEVQRKKDSKAAESARAASLTPSSSNVTAASSSSTQLPIYTSPAGPARSPSTSPSASISTSVPPPRAESPGPPPLIPVSSLAAPQPSSAPVQSPTSQPSASMSQPSASASQPSTLSSQPSTSSSQPSASSSPPPPLSSAAQASTDAGANLPLPLVAEIDAILAAAPPPPPGGHTPLSILNLLMGGGAQQTAGTEQAGPAPGPSSVDDID